MRNITRRLDPSRAHAWSVTTFFAHAPEPVIHDVFAQHSPTSDTTPAGFLLLITVACLFITSGCSDRVDDVSGPRVDLLSSSASDMMTGQSDGQGADTTTQEDTLDMIEDMGPATIGPVDLETLYCELTDGTLVRAAIWASACLDLSMAGILDEAARGFVHGNVLTDAYAPVTYGNCDMLSCLAQVNTCADAEQCLSLVRGEACENDSFARRCNGQILEACQWNGTSNQWVRIQECQRLGAVCEADPGIGDNFRQKLEIWSRNPATAQRQVE